MMIRRPRCLLLKHHGDQLVLSREPALAIAAQMPKQMGIAETANGLERLTRD